MARAHGGIHAHSQNSVAISGRSPFWRSGNAVDFRCRSKTYYSIRAAARFAQYVDTALRLSRYSLHKTGSARAAPWPAVAVFVGAASVMLNAAGILNTQCRELTSPEAITSAFLPLDRHRASTRRRASALIDGGGRGVAGRGRLAPRSSAAASYRRRWRLPLGERAQAQRVELDEARRVVLVVGDGAFLEGDEVLVVERIRAVAADRRGRRPCRASAARGPRRTPGSCRSAPAAARARARTRSRCRSARRISASARP